jgi:hypothetical protein
VAPKFRESEFIDFNSGMVELAPIQLQFRMNLAGDELRLSDLIRLFQCRVEVWHLGVAAQIINSIEYSTPPAIWSHSAYGVIAVVVNYFETMGAILNENRAAANDLTPAAADFEAGFRDIYPNYTTSSGASLAPRDFHSRMHNGLFALGSTPRGLWVHNTRSISPQDFDVIQKNPADASTRKYYINPHSTDRTIIDHYPTLIARLNDPDARYDALRSRLKAFTGEVNAG